MTILASELRKLYAAFFEERGHQLLASASLLPENDPTCLFTSAGMHPLIPYLLGEKHPNGKRLVSVQKCIRTDDIDEVGDDTHLTFFEMLGNWSLGDYYKSDAIGMSYEFLTQVLNIPAERLAVTVFEGDALIPRDTEAASLWIKHGLKADQIYYYGREENWWGPAGQTGPCGTDTEIFYDINCDQPACSPQCGPACHCGKYVEIWNNVFMHYNKTEDGTYEILPQKNVDTGMGFERILTIFNGYTNVYDTELFTPVMTRLNELLEEHALPMSLRDKRIVCEHIRAVTFILGEPKRIVPTNTEQGYILRRLIRRIIRILKTAGIEKNILIELAMVIIYQYSDIFVELKANEPFILEQLEKEYFLFNKTLDVGLRKAEQYFIGLENGGILNAERAFKLYDTFGFPIEFTTELAQEKGIQVDMDGFKQRFMAHQEKSRQGAEDKFKGGLADHSVLTTRLHTATHLLNGALRKVLGNGVFQRGSNITAERLRFDFSFDRKLTREELDEITGIVNDAISKQLDIIGTEMTADEAYDAGAIGIFEDKYTQRVKVYEVPGYSHEICGGPHAKNTSELGHFRILKEEASSSGVRRIKAILD